MLVAEARAGSAHAWNGRSVRNSKFDVPQFSSFSVSAASGLGYFYGFRWLECSELLVLLQ